MRAETLQRSVTLPEQPAAAVAPLIQDVLSSGGQPLATETQEFMEARLGYDFSKVRIHTDERAVTSAQAVNALAYTAGHDIVFGEGQYMPQAQQGRHLLAHEFDACYAAGGRAGSWYTHVARSCHQQPL